MKDCEEPNKRLVLDAVLAEYKEVKSESIHKLQTQTTLISLYVTVLGVLLTLGLSNDITSTQKMSFLHPYFFTHVIPAIAISISILWLDQVYRQIKIAIYISHIEEKVNRLLGTANNVEDSAMFWERWLRNIEDDMGIFSPSQTFYYICLGIFILCPILSFCFGLYINDFEIRLIPTVIIAIVYVIFLLLIIMYVWRILKYNKQAVFEINSQDS